MLLTASNACGDFVSEDKETIHKCLVGCYLDVSIIIINILIVHYFGTINNFSSVHHFH